MARPLTRAGHFGGYRHPIPAIISEEGEPVFIAAVVEQPGLAVDERDRVFGAHARAI
jgi:hypothetical protein